MKLRLTSDHKEYAQDCISNNFDTGIERKKDLIDFENHNKGIINKKGKVNLTDCLACSGCVTVDESDLLEANSFKILESYTEPIDLIFSYGPLSINALCQFFQQSKENILESIRLEFYSLLPKKSNVFIIDQSLAQKMRDNLLIREQKENKAGVIDSHCPAIIKLVQGKYESRNLSIVPSVQIVQNHLLNKKMIDLRQKTVGFIKLNQKQVHCFLVTCSEKRLELSSGLYFMPDDFSHLTLKYKNLPASSKYETLKGHEDLLVRNDNFCGVLNLVGESIEGYANVVQVLDNKNSKTESLELMACKGGCANGNGMSTMRKVMISTPQKKIPVDSTLEFDLSDLKIPHYQFFENAVEF